MSKTQPPSSGDPEVGENVLVCSSPVSLGRKFVFDLLDDTHTAGDSALIISTSDPAPHVLDTVTSSSAAVSRDTVGVVDCVTQQAGADKLETPRVGYVSDPRDFTGVGIKTGAIWEILEKSNSGDTRVIVDSLTQLVELADTQSLYQFLHVFTARVKSSDGIGFYHLDPNAVDEKTLHLLMGLFDRKVEIEPGTGGDYTVAEMAAR